MSNIIRRPSGRSRDALRFLRHTGALALLTAASLQAQIHVNANAAPGGNGSSWSSALQDLQQALALAAGGGEIWIAEGTYLPGATQGSSFVIPSGVTLHGAFLGFETSVQTRAGSVQNTILSGDLDGNPANIATDAFHVVVVPGGSSNIWIEGVRIERGNALASPSGRGGGIEIDGNLPDFVYDVAIDNCIIENNLARFGGGVSATYIARLTSKLCTFRNNRARASGGGVYLYYAGSGNFCEGDGVKIMNAWFTGNYAPQGGGLWNALNDTQMWIANCKFHDNEASLGGAVYHGDAVLTGSYPLHVVNCTIAYNHAIAINGNGSLGAGFYFANQGSLAYLDNTIVWGNYASYGSLNRPAASLEGPGANPMVLTVRYSDIQIDPVPLPPASPAWPGVGNINAYPNFLDATNRDLRLGAFSPCVDAGDDFAVPFDYLDLDADGSIFEQLPREFFVSVVREINDGGVADTGVDDNGTNSFTDPFCGQSGPGGAVDNGVVDMGCHERRALSQ